MAPSEMNWFCPVPRNLVICSNDVIQSGIFVVYIYGWIVIINQKCKLIEYDSRVIYLVRKKRFWV